MIQVKVTCPECKAQRWLRVIKADFDSWRNGALIQNAMPYLSPSEREALISGFCDTCWDVHFGFEEFEREFENV